MATRGSHWSAVANDAGDVADNHTEGEGEGKTVKAGAHAAAVRDPSAVTHIVVAALSSTDGYVRKVARAKVESIS